MAFIPALLTTIGTSVGASAATAGATGSIVASTAVSVLGAGASALAEANANRYRAKIYEQQAKQSQEQASLRASEVARNTTQRQAAIRAAALENGVELSGSLTDILNQSSRQGSLDYLTAVYDGSVQASNLQSSAALARRQARGAITGGLLGAASRGIAGVSDVYGRRGNTLNVGGANG